jgi:hypothetical protein
MRPWTATRQLLAVAAVAALTLLAPGLPPTPAAFAHDTPRVTPSRPPSPTAQAKVELEGTLEIIHEDRDDGSGEYHHTLLTDDGARWALDGVPHGRELLTGDRVRIKGHEQSRTACDTETRASNRPWGSRRTARVSPRSLLRIPTL